jgi:hypothetical protein
VCLKYDISKSRLLQHIQIRNVAANGGGVKRPRAIGTFSVQLQVQLLDEIKNWNLKTLTGTFSRKVRERAFQIAEKNKLKHTFNTTAKMANSYWYTSFLRRYSELQSIADEAVRISKLKKQPEKEIKQDFVETIATEVNKIEKSVPATITEKEATQIKHGEFELNHFELIFKYVSLGFLFLNDIYSFSK